MTKELKPHDRTRRVMVGDVPVGGGAPVAVQSMLNAPADDVAANLAQIEALAEADPQAGACPVQGNLDPALLAAPWPLVAEEVDAVLAAGRAAPGHVVNLGHGVPPATDADVLSRIVARVHGSADWESVALAGWEA